MLGYMERKYGEVFIAKESYAGQFGRDYTMLKVQSLNKKIDGILVRAVKKENGISYQDNYLAYLLRGQVVQKVREAADEILGRYKVFYKIPEMVFPEEFPADMEVDAFLRHPHSMIKIYFYIKNIPENPKEQFERLLLAFQQKGYIMGGVLSYPRDIRAYQMINDENFTRDIYLGYQYKEEAIFSMDEKGTLAYLEWKG